MTRFEKRNPSGQLVKGTLNIDQKEIDITPVRNTTRIQINDKKKSKSVSMNINQFMKMVDGLKYIVGCHNEFYPNNQLVMEQPQLVMQQQLDQNTSSRTNRPQPTPARTDEPQPTPARTNKPQPTPARTNKPQPTPARTDKPQSTPARNNRPQPTPARTDEPQPTSARTDEPQSTSARTDEPQSTPARTDEPQPTPARTDDPQPTPARTDKPQSTPARTNRPQPTPARTDEPQPTSARTNEPQSTPARTDEPQPVPDSNLAQQHETIPKQRKRACDSQLSQAVKRPRVDPKSDSLVTNCDVNMKCTVTFNKAVKATTSGGKGFCRCDCANGKKLCQTLKCQCFKGGNKCNSRCHNDAMCKNK